MQAPSKAIMNQIYKNMKCYYNNFPYEHGKELTDDILKEFYSKIQEEIDNFRTSGEPSKLCRNKSSRHYECHEVAKILDDGIAVGWTYWYGGGKYGEPEALDWIEDSYFLDVSQEMKIVNIYKFKNE